MIKAALDKKADVLITGDIDHHTGIDAVAQGLAVIDAGHYGIEHIFIEDVRIYLEEKLPGIEAAAAPGLPSRSRLYREGLKYWKKNISVKTSEIKRISGRNKLRRDCPRFSERL